MQIFLSFCSQGGSRRCDPCGSRAASYPVEATELSETYFRATPIPEIAGHLVVYAFITTWLALS